MLSGILILKKSVKWARVINPILLTAAFMLERPLIPVYGTPFQVWSSCINMSCTYLVPWFICETLGGQTLSWILTFTPILVQNHYHFDMVANYATLVPVWLICMTVYILISLDMPMALKKKIH